MTEDERECIANLYLTKKEIRDLKSLNTFSKFYFFPVLCRYYSNHNFGCIVKFFSNPIPAVEDELYLLFTSSDQITFATLFLFVVFNNCVPENLFIEKCVIKTKLEDLSDNFNVKSKFSVEVAKLEMEKLKKSYVKKINAAYTFIHDKVFEIFVHFCGKHVYDFMLEVAHPCVIRDRFVFKNLLEETIKHANVVEISPERENKYFERLKKDAEQGLFQTVFFSNPNLNDIAFRSNFI